MYFEENTVDDLMFEVFEELLRRPFEVETSRGQESGSSSEIIGATLKLRNPRARLSRTETKGTLFSALGETFWYLSKGNDSQFIQYYIKRYEKESEDKETVYGAYGPRLFNSQEKYNQISNVLSLLKKRPTSRKAAIQIFEARDLEVKETLGEHKGIPCTCTLQFLLRDNALHMVAFMRSNDAFWGLPHDIFAFTMLQEIVARTLSAELGSYTHSVGSLHLYKKMENDARNFISEGLQPTKNVMDAMPKGDPWPAIDTLLEFEKMCRLGESVDTEKLNLEPYWKDLALILQIYANIKSRNFDEVNNLQLKLSNDAYKIFAANRLNKALNTKHAP